MKNMNDNELQAAETDIVSALLEAKEYRQNRAERTIVINRGGKILFTFRITGLDEDVWRKCRRNNLRRHGQAEELDGARFISQAIYEATVAEDKHIWNNREIWENFNVTNGADVVNLILFPAEKTRLGEILEELSGYNVDVDDLVRD